MTGKNREEKPAEVAVPFASDTGNPEAEAAKEDERRFRREIARSVAIHTAVPALLVLLLPALVTMFGSGRKLGTGEASVEVALLTEVPGDASPSVGQVAREAPAAAARAPESPAAPEGNAVPESPAAPPADERLPERVPEPPDELSKAMFAARTALEKRAPEITAETPASTPGAAGKLLGAARRKGSAGAAAGAGVGEETRDAGGENISLKGNYTAAPKGFGFGLEGEGDTAGTSDLENERRAWRHQVGLKVNKYTLRRPTKRALYPPGRPLYIHISFFPDGTLRDVTLRPPSSTNAGPAEEDFLKYTATNVEQAQPLPKPKNAKLLEKGLDMRSFILNRR